MAAGGQLRQQLAGERDDRLDVQAHEPALALRRRRGEGAIGGDAGVVDKQLELELGRAREQKLDPCARSEIGDERLESAAACLDLVSKGTQALAASRHREYRIAALGERQCELAAETR